MVRHSTLVGDELHYPLGHSTAGALELLASQTGAYLIQDASLNDWLRLDTQNSRIDLGSTGVNPTFRFLGSGRVSLGTIQLNELAGAPSSGANIGLLYTLDVAGVTHLRYKDSGGTEHTLTPVSSGASSTGTTSNTFTINTDAADTADENAQLILIGSDDDTGSANDDLVRSTLTLDATNERVYWTQDRNRASAGYTRIAPRFGIGTPSSITSGFNPILEFHTGSGSVAFTGTLTYTHDATGGTGYLRSATAILSSTDPSGLGEAFGFQTRAAGSTSVAVGRICTASGGVSIAIGNQVTASGSRSVGLGNAPNVSGPNAIVICADTSTASHTAAILIGDGLTSSADNQFAVRCTEAILGRGNSNATPPSVTLRLTDAAAGGLDTSAGSLTITPGRPTGAGNGGDLIVTTAPPGASSSTVQTAVERFRITDTGQVGIGNVGASPSAHVHILDNTTSTDAILLIDQDGTGDAAMRFDAGSASWMVGCDNSNSDGFAIAETTALGSASLDRFRIAGSSGPMRFVSHVAGNAAVDEGFSTQTGRVETENATPVTAWSLVVPERSTILVVARVVARNGSDAAGYVVIGTFDRDSSGNVNVVGTVSVTHTAEDDSAWNATLDHDTGTQTVRLRATGDSAGTTAFTWVVQYQSTYV